ncbi:MAG: hypothetical protein KJ574_01045 [Nanoarchaeota archaeon]|nr:hypothetical protein [Nanoarchaeota archaeon]
MSKKLGLSVGGLGGVILVLSSCTLDTRGTAPVEGIDELAPHATQLMDPQEVEVLNPATQMVDSFPSMEDHGFFTDYLPNPGNDDISAYTRNLVPALNQNIADAVRSAMRDGSESTFYKESDFRTIYEAYMAIPDSIEDVVARANIQAFQSSFRAAYGTDSDSFMDFINSSEGVYAGLDIDGRYGMGIVTDDVGIEYFVIALRGLDENDNYFIGLSLVDLSNSDNAVFRELADAYRTAFTRR